MEDPADEITIRTPWEELEARFQALAAQPPADPGPSPAAPEYQSCLRVGGRPILPPLMTAQRRTECLRWKDRAEQVQRKLEEARRHGGAEESSESEGEEDDESSSAETTSGESQVVFTRSSSSRQVASPRLLTAEEEERSKSAFKALIHRLRGELSGPNMGATPSHHLSTQSVDTVIENPAFREEAEEERSAPTPSDDTTSKEESSPMRQRSGSYTLEEPSPLLRAYMEKYGDGDMSFSASDGLVRSPKRKAKRTPSPKRDPKEVLGSYLSDLSAMPPLTCSARGQGKPKPVPLSTSEADEDSCREESVAVGGADAPGDVSRMSVASSAMHSVSLQVATPTPSEMVPRAPTDPQPMEAQRPEEEPEGEKDTDQPVSEPNAQGGPAEQPSAQSSADAATSPVNQPAPPVPPLSEQEISLDAARSLDPNLLLQLQLPELESGASASRQIESAVSSLAQEQQKKVQQLMRDQEEQRQHLAKLFREQQQKLIDQILESVQHQTSGREDQHPPATPAFSMATPLPYDLPPRSGSPVVPAATPMLRPMSTLPPGYAFPPEALTPEMHHRLCKLSALARGHLTRRLMKTHKVQSIISSLRDTMVMALRLHRESIRAGPPEVTEQDVELHRRLLQQINKDCQSLHDVFFTTSLKARMSVIALDHEIKKRQLQQGAEGGGKRGSGRRVSAATLARIEEKQKLAEMTEERQRLNRVRRPRQPARRSLFSFRSDKENRAGRPARARSTGSSSRSRGRLYGKGPSPSPRRSLNNITDSQNSEPMSTSAHGGFSGRATGGAKAAKLSAGGRAGGKRKKPWK